MKESKAFLQKLDQGKLHDFILSSLQENEQFEVAYRLAFKEPTDEDLRNLTSKIDKSLNAFTDARPRAIDFPEVTEYMTRAHQGHIKFAFDAAKYLFERLVEMQDCFTPDCFTEDKHLNDCDAEGYLRCRFRDFITIAKLAIAREDRAYVFGGCLELHRLDFQRLAYFKTEFLKISARLMAHENHLNKRAELSFFEDANHGDRFNELLFEITVQLYWFGPESDLPMF
ncbi:MAG: hypothetical protein LBT59_00480 [Clostridiales bacterium]|nr:hypothetical protein [Clostridiales bacterium]